MKQSRIIQVGILAAFITAITLLVIVTTTSATYGCQESDVSAGYMHYSCSDNTEFYLQKEDAQ